MNLKKALTVFLFSFLTSAAVYVILRLAEKHNGEDM